ncbi:cysteine hydrolase [Niveibacterium terrae]|uniref:cysteine hydrolase n=1 Tax=Niveibacterium terrae TaxID=3373598 RepID=UPI003A90E6F0
MSRTHLLIIDPQNDFCDLTDVPFSPALPVPGADADLKRIATLIRRVGEALSGITLTLDSHHFLDIGHPGFWRKGDGAAVPPFTAISAAALREGDFLPRRIADRDRVLAYLDALEAAGRYQHMVWPVHCRVGSWGQGVHADLLAACDEWSAATQCNVATVAKGLNPWTEHYSAIRAEVPDPDDQATQGNAVLLERLREADVLYVAGEAGSHCVKATVEHLAEAFSPPELRRLVLIEDGMSPVAGFEAQQRDFLAAMKSLGARILSSEEATGELLAAAGR